MAAVLGVPSHRIHPVLDLRDEPIAQYVHQEEADRVAEELASRGLDVTVRRRLRRRKSLQELTRRASPSLPQAKPLLPPAKLEPVAVDAPRSVAPVAQTIRPGWLALDDSGPARPVHAGTAVGIPAWTDSNEDITAPPPATENAQPDQGALNSLMAVDATADTVAPDTQGGQWSDILGAALADRLVEDGSLAAQSGVAKAVTVSPRARRSADPAISAPTENSPEVSSASVTASDTSAPSVRTLASPVGSDTLHPGHARAEASHVAPPEPVGESPAPANAGSAWAVAGIDVPKEVVRAPGGVLRPVASMDERKPSIAEKPASTGTLLMDAADAFAGFEEAALATASDPPPPADDLTVGDKFTRLRQPSAEELSEGPEPNIALLWGIAAPGAGFAYLGEPSRGFNYALGSIFLFPWLKGALDASKLAEEVKEGRALLRRKPDPLARFLYVACFWSFVAIVVFAIAAVIPDRSSSTPPDPVVGPIVEVDDRSEAATPDEAPEPEAAEEDAVVEPGERELNALVREARHACEEGRYAECERLAGHALDIDGRNRQALILQVEAVSHSSRTRPVPSENDNDRQPDSPAP